MTKPKPKIAKTPLPNWEPQPPLTPNCTECFFYKPAELPKYDEGICRRFPPPFQTVTNIVWCGEYKFK